MKKPIRPDHVRETFRPSPKDCPKSSGKEGRWSFNLASESLFTLGATESSRRVAYRTADGQLRFLPL